MKNMYSVLTRFQKSLATLMASGLKAKRVGGLGMVSQAVEMARLWQSPNRLSPSEYYDFNLCDRRLNWATKSAYLGWRSPVIADLQSTAWHALANDKLAYYGLMAGLGFNVPRIFAIYHKGERFFGDVPVFKSHELLAGFLRNGCTFPFYGKPVHGFYGEGNVLCTAYVPESDSLRMASGELTTVNEFVAQILDRGGSGYLFQQVLTTSPKMAELWGERLSTVRIVVAHNSSEPQVILAEWKVATGKNIIDNFHGGATGNLIASVDVHTGRIQHVALPNGEVSSEKSLVHPDTGMTLVGAAVPEWNAMMKFALKAARVFPGLRLQGWDIAHTATGFVPLEVNLVTGRTAYEHQLFMNRGLFGEELRRTWGAAARTIQ